MQAWITQLVALAILLAAGALAYWHLRIRRVHRESDLTPAQRDFYHRQFRRRIQVSAMLGILAVMLAAESWLTQPLAYVLIGLGMLLLLLWIMLLAVMDAVATRFHFERLRGDYLVERAKLEAEARRLRAAGGNGKPPTKAAKRKKK